MMSGNKRAFNIAVSNVHFSAFKPAESTQKV